MVRVREIMTAAGTLACAVGIGVIMQSSDTSKERYGDQPVVLNDAEAIDPEVVSSVVNSSSILQVDAITLTSAQTDSGATALTAESGVVFAAATDVLEPPVASDALPLPACEIIASARPAASAMIDVTLSAPCLPNERVTVHHNGMLFSQITDGEGTLNVIMPTLSRTAVVVFAFPSGDGAIAETVIEDIDEYERAVLQWRGDTGFQMHAREFGADYGEVGHVWAQSPEAMGTLTRLGDAAVSDPFMVEVYSLPRSRNRNAAGVDMSVEAEVTLANCGSEIEAQSFELTPDGIKKNDLTLAVPNCDAVGDFLVLNNLVQDLKVASN